ncbi:MAG: TniQ family protein, partial [Proteobacteria bacterium]|nr:TniQ family protein [Pseudomonadota bacterium]
MWPIRLPVQKDESLQSWLIRSAYALGLTPDDLVSIVLGKRLKIFDIDLDITNEEIETLSGLSGMPQQHLFNATLSEFINSIAHLCSKNKYKWITTYLERKQKSRKVVFCPLCLSSDEVPYLRRRWRFAFETYCTKHRILLIDRCTKCDYLFSVDDICLYDKTKLNCSNCGLKISKMKVNDKLSLPRVCLYTKAMEPLIIDNHSLTFFDKLHILITFLFASHANFYFIRYLIKAEIPNIKKQYISHLKEIFFGNTNPIEKLSIEQRDVATRIATTLIMCYEKRFY